MRTPLPLDWIDRLFGRLALRYGDAWVRKWEGFEPAAVKVDWANVLAGMQHEDRQHALRFGLEHLPTDYPPNAAQFKAVCDRAPEPPRAALPAPTEPIRAERIEEVRAKLGDLRDFGKPRSPRAWVQALQARHDAGEVMSPAQRDALRAFGQQHGAGWE